MPKAGRQRVRGGYAAKLRLSKADESLRGSLGKENYDHTHQSDKPENPKPALVKKSPSAEDSLTQKIIEDLKPKNYEIA